MNTITATLLMLVSVCLIWSSSENSKLKEKCKLSQLNGRLRYELAVAGYCNLNKIQIEWDKVDSMYNQTFKTIPER